MCRAGVVVRQGVGAAREWVAAEEVLEVRLGAWEELAARVEVEATTAMLETTVAHPGLRMWSNSKAQQWSC